MSEGNANSTVSITKASRYCRRCSYVLDGLTSTACPECGRKFDPANRKTFRTRPRRSLWGRTWRIALPAVLVIGGVAGWLYHLDATERDAMEWVTAAGGFYETEYYGPDRLAEWMKEREWHTIEVVVTVNLSNSVAGDIEFENMRGLSRVRELYLYDSIISDEGIVYLGGLTSLEKLVLSETSITDDGLFHLRRLTGLKSLILSNTSITEKGLVHLKRMDRLELLYLSDTPISNSGLVDLKELDGLRVLWLDKTQITDDGLIHLQAMNNLTELQLDHTSVTDAGLMHLRSLPNLERLSLVGTATSAEGVAELKQAISKLQVFR